MSGGDSGTRVLVVDDIDDNRYTLRRRLRRLGHTDVEEARDGREALERLASEHFDVVLLDIMMPEVSGIDVLERLRAEGRIGDPPVIVISALDEIDAVARCLELGAEDFLTKPFNPVVLKARLGGTLEKKRLRDAAARQLSVIREVFGRYVPESVVNAIVQGEGELAPTEATATILYTDIEDFTRITESIGPARVVQMLNEYFAAVLAPIEAHHGVVNQFQGDAMLVTYNVPVADPAHADHAVQTAREILAVCDEQEFAGLRLRTRIGINTGTVVAGNVGSGDRVNYTVHGDAVNVAARLEALNKEHGSLILVSAETVGRLAGPAGDLHALGPVAIRGRDQPLEVYTLR